MDSVEAEPESGEVAQAGRIADVTVVVGDRLSKSMFSNSPRDWAGLPAEIRAELPLKRIWTVASQDEES